MRTYSSALRSCLNWAVLVSVCMLVMGNEPALAANGEMVVVTANPGKIMEGARVLAEIPRGTRVWVFKLSADQKWAEVPVPNADQHGWMLVTSLQPFNRTAAQEAELTQAAQHSAAFLKFYAAQKYAAAQTEQERCLVIERRILSEDHPDIATSLNNMGVLARIQEDYPAARKFHEESLAIYRKTLGHNHLDTADPLHNLGVLAYDQRDYSAARKFYDEALAIKRKVLGNEHASTASTLYNLGGVASKQVDYPAARKFYDEALAIQRKVLGNEHPSTAETLNNAGTLAVDQGDFTAARKYLNEALVIKHKVLGQEHQGTGETLNNLGDLARAQGDHAAASKYFDEALGIFRKTLGHEHTYTANVLNNLGVVSWYQGDFPAARKSYDEALTIFRKVLGNTHPNTADTLHNLGNLTTNQGDYAAARKYYDEALEICRQTLNPEHPSTANLLNNLGILAAEQKEYSDATQFFDQARRNVRLHVIKTLPSLAANEQAEFLQNTYVSNWVMSLSLSHAVRAQEPLLATSVDWLLNGKAVAQEALAARELLLRDATNPATAPLVAELQAARKTLAAFSLSTPKPEEAAARQAQLTELTAREQRLSQQLAQATGGTTVQTPWVSLDQVRRALPARSLYVDVVRITLYDFQAKKYSDPKYLAWLIPAHGSGKIQLVDLGAAAAIDAAVERVRTQLAAANQPNGAIHSVGENQATAQLGTDLQAAARLVLDPWKDQLPQGAPLILSPDGALWLLPWAALPVAENKSLLEDHSLRMVLSGRDLLPQHPTGQLQPTAPAIVVNPDYDLAGAAAKAALQKALPGVKFDDNATRGVTSRSSLPRVKALPFTSLEGQAAKPSLEQLSQSTPVMYEQDQALEGVVKKFQRPKHLLLSTHGFFLPDQIVKQRDGQQLLASSDTRSLPALTPDGKPVENPLLRCGLLFAGCNSPRTQGLDDGILTGLEIVGMDLRGTELVVLSACETGIGRVRNGEGVAGLRQAFQLAGAQSVVSTLWQVPDLDSAIIMQDFFTNLAAGQTKADALRNAQLKRFAARKAISGAAHPFFWAAWTVTGE